MGVDVGVGKKTRARSKETTLKAEIQKSLAVGVNGRRKSGRRWRMVEEDVG